jgi:negative regulator of flagellin synthesis FlgM
MRINGTNNIANVYKSKKSNKAYGGNTVSSAKDEVSFSSFAKDLAVAKKAIDKTPDVRMEKVSDIKAQIQAGQYNISASQIADKLLAQSRSL